MYADFNRGAFPQGTRLSFTFIEIYNENVYDLFTSESAASKKNKSDTKVSKQD